MSDFLEIPTIDGHVHVRAVSGFEDQLKLIEQHGFAAINAVCTAARNESSLKGNLVGLLFKGLYPTKYPGTPY